MREHFKNETCIVGRVTGYDGLVHIAEEREFRRSGMRMLFEHCTNEPLFEENLISNEIPLTCLTCLVHDWRLV